MFKKKSLGQHFLRNLHILQKIVDAAGLGEHDTVLEVGPGEGVLTELLLARAGRRHAEAGSGLAEAGKVIAVEKDDRLIPVLQRKFANEIASGRLHLIHADILSLPAANYQLPTTNYKVVANLPYYITGAFLRKFLQDTEHQPSSMTLLLQKEVAKRIVAADGKESLLSISVKAYGTPRYIATVKAGAFSPPPKVDSAIITIENISRRFFETGPRYSQESGNPGKEDVALDSRLRGNDREKEFFRLLKKGFAHPRKLLASNLGLPPEALRSCGIAEKARPEDLFLEEWRCLGAHSCLEHS